MLIFYVCISDLVKGYGAVLIILVLNLLLLDRFCTLAQCWVQLPNLKVRKGSSSLEVLQKWFSTDLHYTVILYNIYNIMLFHLFMFNVQHCALQHCAIIMNTVTMLFCIISFLINWLLCALLCF